MMTKQGKMSAVTAAKTRLSARAAQIRTRSARMPKPPGDNPAFRWQFAYLSGVMRRPWAATETRRPGNPPRSAVPDAGGQGSAADWDRGRSPGDRDARWRGPAAG